MRVSKVARNLGLYSTVLVAIFILACGGGTGGGSSGELTVGGDAGVVQVLQSLAGSYGEVGFHFVAGGDSAGGVESTTEGTYDLGATARPLKATEQASGLLYVPFAKDRVLVIVNPRVAITALNSDQVREVFIGLAAARNLDNWSAIGGPDAGIVLMIRDEDASATGSLRKGTAIGRDRFAPWAQMVASDDEMLAGVAGTPNSIGYISYSTARGGDLSSVTVLAIDGHDPTESGNQYPVAVELAVVYLPDNAAKVQPFLDYITSPEAQKLLVEKGLEPVK